VLCLAGAAFFGLLGVDTDVAGESYDCGAPIARLGGDDREQKWAEDSFILNTETGDIPPDDLPQRACKRETDDQLTFVYILGPLGVVLVAAAVVVFFVGQRREQPASPAGSMADPGPTPPPPSPASG
jgi:hypothetical protein